MMRLSLTLVSIGIAAAVVAQSGHAHHCWARLLAPITAHSPKPLFVALLEVDPTIDISYQNEELRISSPERWTRQSLRAAVEPLGYQVMAFAAAGSALEFQQWIPHETWPRYVDTGDPANDQARLDADRAAWINANPEAYQAMVDQLNALGDEQ